MYVLSKNRLNILTIIEAIEKIEKYSQEFTNPDEIWEIIQEKLKPLKIELVNISE